MWGYHEYHGVFSIVWYSNNKRFFPYGTEHPHDGTHDTPHGQHDIPMGTMISPTVLRIPHGTQDTPSTQDITHSIEHSHSAQDILPTCIMISPTVLNSTAHPHSTAHTLYRVFILRGYQQLSRPKTTTFHKIS